MLPGDAASEAAKTIAWPRVGRAPALRAGREHRAVPFYAFVPPTLVIGVAALAYLNLGWEPVGPRVVVSVLYALTVGVVLAVISRRQSLRLAAGWTPLFVGFALFFAAAMASAALYWMPTTHPGAGQLFVLTLECVCLLLPGQLMFDAIKPPKRVLVVGHNGVSELMEALREQRQREVEVIAVWAHDVVEMMEHGLRVERWSLERTLKMLDPDFVVVATPDGRPAIYEVLANGGHRGFCAFGLPEFYEHWFGKVPVRALGPAWFMSMLHLYHRPYSRIVKRLLDVVVASLAIVITLPAFALVATVVATTGRPIIFRQTRMGVHGKPFTIYKFRTMRRDAEVAGAVWATRRDPRATTVGRVLRRSRLDELPQLWNVLRGDMSIVGPRPERPEFTERLEREIPYWTKRQLLKPGITGWAQISHSYASDERETETKLSYDLWYLRHQSLSVDLLICLRTIPRMLFGTGSR